MDDSIFLQDGERFIPTDLARGPWSPQAQHGGAPAALLAHIIEGFAGGDAMFVARLTIELLRPVPLSPLSVRSRLTRPGRKVQLVEASLFVDEVEIVRASGLRIRRATIPMPSDLPSHPPPPAPQHGTYNPPPWAQATGERAFHSHAVEHRFVRGTFAEGGAATDWIRLRVPLIAGLQTSPLSRVAAAADFGNGISWVLGRAEGYSFINPDLTIYLHRLPASEWVCLDAVTYPNELGLGLAESMLFDEQGAIGRAAQSLIIER